MNGRFRRRGLLLRFWIRCRIRLRFRLRLRFLHLRAGGNIQVRCRGDRRRCQIHNHKRRLRRTVRRCVTQQQIAARNHHVRGAGRDRRRNPAQHNAKVFLLQRNHLRSHRASRVSSPTRATL